MADKNKPAGYPAGHLHRDPRLVANGKEHSGWWPGDRDHNTADRLTSKDKR